MGNHEVLMDVRGQDLVNLALFWLVCPAASLDHTRVFIHNMDPTGVPFLPMAVCCAEHLFGLRQKASSTTCQRVFLPLNKYKRHAFWTYNYPFGGANVKTQDMINVDTRQDSELRIQTQDLVRLCRGCIVILRASRIGIRRSIVWWPSLQIHTKT